MSDRGTNLLKEYLNPKVEISDRTRLFGVIQDYSAPVDYQYRNYCKRSVGLVKKYLPQACGLEKKEALPLMLKSEMEYLLEKAAVIVYALQIRCLKDPNGTTYQW